MPVPEDGDGKPPVLHAVLGQESAALLGVRGVKPERDRVAAEQVPQFVAARRPLLTDEHNHLVTRSVGLGPPGKRLLHLWVEPLLGGDPALEDREVELAERRGALDRFLCARVAHPNEQCALGVQVEGVRSPEEFDPVHLRHPEVGRDQRHLRALASEALQRVEACPGRGGRQHPVVSPEPVRERLRDGSERRRVVVHDHQHRLLGSGIPRRLAVTRHRRPLP